MKKIILLTAALLTVGAAAQAQEFEAGDWGVNVGISLDDTDPLTFGGSIERGLVNNTFGLDGLTLAVGAEVGFASQKNVSALGLGIRVPFHYSPLADLDLYTAPALMWNRGKVKGADAVTDTEFGWTIVGAHYYFTQGFGAFAELGMDNALGFSIGAAFRF